MVLDRAQIFFRRDEDLVLALYARLAAELEARVAELPEGVKPVQFKRPRCGPTLQDSACAIQTVKSSAKRVPIWLTVVAWSMLVAAFILFIAGRQN
jgi:hypothetical protein